MKKNNAESMYIDHEKLFKDFLIIYKRFFGAIGKSFGFIKDVRHSSYITYSHESIFFTGLSLFLFRLGSRHMADILFGNSKILDQNFHHIFGTKIPNTDTLVYLYERVDIEQVYQCNYVLINNLIRHKTLDYAKYLGKYYMIVFDGTQLASSNKMLNDKCLHKKLKNGVIHYYFYVLEAKIITPDGLCFSIASEFVENQTQQYTKQDCEHRAAIRLIAKIKKEFARLEICLLLDGLFADGVIFQACKDKNWQYITTLKDDDLKSVNTEFEALSKALPSQFKTLTLPTKIQQEYRWVNDIQYCDTLKRTFDVNVIQCIETKPDKPYTKFKYVTSFKITDKNYQGVVFQGRLRWTIENQGFNVQKNNDFELEHAYCKSPNAYKVFYVLLQLAHSLLQLFQNADCMKDMFKKCIKTAIALSKFMLEAWRFFTTPDDIVFIINNSTNQFRLNTS